MTFNIKKYFNQHGFSSYSSAYVMTNEDLRNTLKCMPQDTDNALVVAASGDHPIYAKLYGAKNIDTFDISFNARLIMDIKTSALSLLNYEEYCKLLQNLCKTKDVMRVENMPKIVKTLKTFEQQYINEMRLEGLFNKEIRFNSMALPTSTEFQKMQQVVNQPFDFIWSDIQTLHTKLKRNYDFMHLSNIFDYVGTYQNCIDILDSLVPYTNPNCNICITCFTKNAAAICENFIWMNTLRNNKDQSWVSKPVPEIKNCTHAMHRVR